MGLSKTKRILLLLAIDSAFFLLELIVGYAVHSLALVADAFHMLNDVLSLCVGLWAVRVANSGSSSMYTYGWQRAETLGALINGVFLVALCLSIFLEAIQRFVEPQVVSNPKLVMIVGCFGLASNILGLVLFHEHGHGHSHGEEEESHSHSHDPISNAEEGHSHSHSQNADTARVADESGSTEDILPQVHIEGLKGTSTDGASSPELSRTREIDVTTSPRTPARRSVAANTEYLARHRRRRSGSRGFGSVDSIHIHPASFRNEIINAARQEDIIESDPEEEVLLEVDGPGDTPDTHVYQSFPSGSPNRTSGLAGYGTIRKQSTDYDHTSHNHRQLKSSASDGHGGHGHSHGDLNMRGVFLHVMGDALGNIGVIGSALFIWLTDYSWRYYVDPGVSLVITVIILTSAIPLCKAASRILLQAVPAGMSIDEIKQDIEKLNRVIEAHHLHVWQLSDTKLVASLHVKVDCEVEGSGSASYMHLAREIRQCLHEYGIHSSTIQPEFCAQPSNEVESSSPTAVDSSGLSPRTGGANGKGSKAGSMASNERSCLLDCQDDCGSRKQCCPPDVGKK